MSDNETKAKAVRVLHLHGMSNQQIAATLNLDPSTVHRYVENERHYDAEYAAAKAAIEDEAVKALNELDKQIAAKGGLPLGTETKAVADELTLTAELGDALVKGFNS